MMNNTKKPIHPPPNLLFGSGLLGKKVKRTSGYVIE